VQRAGARPARPARPPLARRPGGGAVELRHRRPRPRRRLVGRVRHRAGRHAGADAGHRARGPARAARAGRGRGGACLVRPPGGGGGWLGRRRGGGGPVATLPDIEQEAGRVLDATADVPLRLLGGLAIALATPGERLLPRPYKDIDFIAPAGTKRVLLERFAAL